MGRIRAGRACFLMRTATLLSSPNGEGAKGRSVGVEKIGRQLPPRLLLLKY